jgi:hypothetical protein
MDVDADTLLAFKRGFLDFCCDNGLSKEAAAELINTTSVFEKEALSPATLLARLAVHARRAGRAVAPYGRAVAPYVAPAALAGGAAALGGAAATGTAGVVQHVPNLYMQALPYMVGLGGAAGLALGSGIGHGMASLDDDAETPEQIKAKELAQTYQTYADQIKAKKKYNQSRMGDA